jgi:nitronate monooxygenase
MVGWPNRRFLDLVGTEHPIVQAPMANAASLDLCVAAARGGALGFLPCGMLPPDQIREQLRALRQEVRGPVGLNFFCHHLPGQTDDSEWRELLQPYYAAFDITAPPAAGLRMPFDENSCAVVEELRPDVVSFHFGLPDEPLFDRVKATGAKVIGCATTVAEAIFLDEAGVDAIIAQGFEAGGHTGGFLGDDPREALGLFALVPQVVDHVRVPVIAAGAIADGRGVAAALTLGASAVQIGSAYLHCPESFLPDGHKEMLKKRATLMTNIYSGGLARAVRGRLIDEIGPIRAEAPPYPLAALITMPLFAAAMEREDYSFLPGLAGQNARMGESIGATELTTKLATDALAILSGRA